MNGQKQFMKVDHNDLFPYLLVNIGSGVSMIKVDDLLDCVACSMITKTQSLNSFKYFIIFI